MNHSDQPRRRSLTRRLPAPLRSSVTLFVLLVCLALEFTLQLGDRGFIDIPRLRSTAYEYGGFWPGLLQNWRPNYAGQPALMFVTYGFLHGGLAHFLVNMITLISLGQEVRRRVGELRYGIIYLAALIGGAAMFAALSTGFRPMVGASGALFGLAGAIVALEGKSSIREGLSLGPSVRFALLLVALNGVMYWALQGGLAWETHLGGALAGFVVALFLNSPPSPNPD